MVRNFTFVRAGLLALVVLMTTSAFAQSVISGTIMDGSNNEPLIGASISVKGTSIGTTSDVDGKYTLNGVPAGSETLVVSFIGFFRQQVTIGSQSVINLTLAADASILGEIIVIGASDIAIDRQTPVALSNITSIDIEEKGGNQEFPELMKSTPSVYATKTGGGYGDSRISVRGFDQVNTAVLINGQPVNDMENGRVYWSNWAGLQDVASGIQMQRGLGASSLAVPSVGGTINIVTNATDAAKGGGAKIMIGNDGYQKYTANYASGTGAKGWSTNLLLGTWKGNGYVDGTMGQGFTYFAGIGYKPNARNAINFNFTGAGQWHHQRTSWISIRDYENFGTPGEVSRKFNLDHGLLNGKEYNFRKNFYNKPIASIDWKYDINDDLNLTTVLYGSWGRGGGTGTRGRNYEIYPFRNDLTGSIDGLDDRTADGLIDYDAVLAKNAATEPYTGSNGQFDGKKVGSNGFREDGVNSGIAIRRASMNSHDWYGGISKIRYTTGNFTLGAGVDLRQYTGYHYRVLNDLLGLDAYYSTGNRNQQGNFVANTIIAEPFNPTGLKNATKIDYFNIGKVGWQAFNGIVEYNTGKLNAVLQAGISNQSYQRVDYFDVAEGNSESDVSSLTGGYVKGGANFNINTEHNVFFNAGFISKQPLFGAVFPNFRNDIADTKNEEITSVELGYGFTTNRVKAKVNLYSTVWGNRFLTSSVPTEGGLFGTANFSGIEQIHKGVEVEINAKASDKLNLRGMLSVGDWKYGKNFEAAVFDDNQQSIGTGTLYTEGVKVGDAAQTTANINVRYKIAKGLSVDADWHYAGNLYARFGINDDTFLEPNNLGAVKLPNYSLFDAGLTYRAPVGKNDALKFRLNVNNLFDTTYISDSNTNIHADSDDNNNWNGVNKLNSVWFGFGRTWNLSASYIF